MSFAAPFRSAGFNKSAINGQVPRRNKSQAKTTGVVNPIPLQAGITQSVRCTSDKVHRCKDPALTYAPYSDDDAVHTVKRHEWAFGRTEDFVDRGQRKTLSNDSSISIFTNANGLRFTDKIKYIGVVANPSEGKGVNPINDQQGTVYLSGTDAPINTGPETIKAGDIVYIDPQPYILEDKYGNKRNGIDFTGLGYPKDKYLFASYPMSATNPNDQICGLRRAITRELRSTNYSYTDYDQFFTRMQQLLKEYQIRDIMPLYNYAFLYACRAACLYHKSKSLPAVADSHIDKWLRKSCIYSWERWCLYYKTASQRQAIVSGLSDTDDLIRLKTESDVKGQLIAGSAQSQNEKLYYWVSESFEEVLTMLTSAQTNFYATYKAGICLQNSAPGMPLHMLLQRF